MHALYYDKLICETPSIPRTANILYIKQWSWRRYDAFISLLETWWNEKEIILSVKEFCFVLISKLRWQPIVSELFREDCWTVKNSKVLPVILCLIKYFQRICVTTPNNLWIKNFYSSSHNFQFVLHNKALEFAVWFPRQWFSAIL